MKPTKFKAAPLFLAISLILLTVGLVSWDQQQTQGKYQQSINDTTPKSKSVDKKIRDLDEVLEELEKADWKVDMNEAMQEVSKALKSIDGDKIKLDIEKAMKDIDLAKIQKDVHESLAKVDFDKLKTEISLALKEVDVAKIQQEVHEALAKMDFDKIKTELEKVKDIDMKKMEEDMKNLNIEMKELGPKLEKEMQKAKVEIEKAKSEIKQYRDFVNGLDNDGLINKKEGYTLKHNDGELYINGKKASEQTYSKYRKFLEDHKKFNIEKNKDDLNLDLD